MCTDGVSLNSYSTLLHRVLTLFILDISKQVLWQTIKTQRNTALQDFTVRLDKTTIFRDLLVNTSFYRNFDL